MTLKMKALTGEELLEQLKGVTAETPRAVRKDRVWVEKTTQVNVRVTETLARLITEEGQKEGGIRRFLARLLKQSGFEVPEDDLNPKDLRRRR